MAEPILDANAAQTYAQPTDSGYFGQFGGRFVAETLTHALDSLAALYAEMKDDPEFKKELHEDLAHFVGRPTPLYLAERLTASLGGAAVYLKREDLNHTGAHKVLYAHRKQTDCKRFSLVYAIIVGTKNICRSNVIDRATVFIKRVVQYII